MRVKTSQNLWDPTKAVIREYFMALNANMRKGRYEMICTLTLRFKKKIKTITKNEGRANINEIENKKLK